MPGVEHDDKHAGTRVLRERVAVALRVGIDTRFLDVSRDLDELERIDLLPLPVLVDFEVGGGQAFDRFAAAIGGKHVDAHEPRTAAKQRLLS